jgi:uncharacterized membrane protein
MKYHKELKMKRLKLPDLLKGLAVLFMIQVHITELLIDMAGRESVFGEISLFLGGPFAAVVFMAVMGYFVAKNKNTLAQNMLRGAKIFILGFLLNIGLNLHLLLKIQFAGWQYDPLEYIFGIDILYLAGLSIIILSILKTFKKSQKWAAVTLLVIVAVLTGFMNERLMVAERNYVLPFIAGNYSWSYFPLFPWLAYPLSGFIFAQYEEKIMFFLTHQKRTAITVFCVLAALVTVFSRQGIETTIDLPAYYHHTLSYSMWASALTVLWIIFLNILLMKFPDTGIGNFFCHIGKNVTLIYVIQWLIIGNIATAVYRNQRISSYVYWFAGIFTLSVLLTFLIEKIRYRLLKNKKSKEQTITC